MAGGSNGYRAVLVRRQLTPGLISSLPGTAGLPPFISFSTSYPDLGSSVRQGPDRVAPRGDRDPAVHEAGAPPHGGAGLAETLAARHRVPALGRHDAERLPRAVVDSPGRLQKAD